MLRATTIMHRLPSVLFALAIAGALSLDADVAHARTMEPGNWIVGAGVGPSFKTGSELGMSGAYFMINGTGEYVFMPEFSAIGSVALGLAGTIPIRIRAGGKYRIIGSQLPLSPFVQAELSAGRMFDVLGTNLNSYGIRAGGGADYFLSANVMIGVLGAIELARTTGDRPANYSTIDILLTCGFVF